MQNEVEHQNGWFNLSLWGLNLISRKLSNESLKWKSSLLDTYIFNSFLSFLTLCIFIWHCINLFPSALHLLFLSQCYLYITYNDHGRIVVPETFVIRISIRISFGVPWYWKTIHHHRKFGPNNWLLVPKVVFFWLHKMPQYLHSMFYGAEKPFVTIEIPKLILMLMSKHKRFLNIRTTVSSK